MISISYRSHESLFWWHFSRNPRDCAAILHFGLIDRTADFADEDVDFFGRELAPVCLLACLSLPTFLRIDSFFTEVGRRVTIQFPGRLGGTIAGCAASNAVCVEVGGLWMRAGFLAIVLLLRFCRVPVDALVLLRVVIEKEIERCLACRFPYAAF